MFKRLAIRTAHDRQQVIYKDLYRRYSNSHRALHWSTQENQFLRFSILFQVGNLRGRKVLDLGSGLGDFYHFLQQERISCLYTGYDIVPEFIKESKKRYPKVHFENRNILTQQQQQRFDYIISSGLFAFGNRTFFYETVKEALSMVRFAYAFNIYKPEFDDDFFSIDKEEILDFLKTLQLSKIVYKDNYLKNDTTYFLYK